MVLVPQITGIFLLWFDPSITLIGERFYVQQSSKWSTISPSLDFICHRYIRVLHNYSMMAWYIQICNTMIFKAWYWKMNIRYQFKENLQRGVCIKPRCTSEACCHKMGDTGVTLKACYSFSPTKLNDTSNRPWNMPELFVPKSYLSKTRKVWFFWHPVIQSKVVNGCKSGYSMDW